MKSLIPEAIELFLSSQLRLLSREQALYKEWYQTKRNPYQIERWLQDTVRGKWGAEAETRVYYIAKNGWDGRTEVPGIKEVPRIFAPVENLYHLSQVLSWIARQLRRKQGSQTHFSDERWTLN